VHTSSDRKVIVNQFLKRAKGIVQLHNGYPYPRWGEGRKRPEADQYLNEVGSHTCGLEYETDEGACGY
jgi:hypothetical protein